MTGSMVAFASVICAVKGIRRDIEIYDRPEIHHKANVMSQTARENGGDFAKTLEENLVTMVQDHPDNTDGIMAAAMAIFVNTGDNYFVVHGHHDESGSHTDYQKLKVNNPVSAKNEIDSMASVKMADMIDVYRNLRE